MNLGLLNKKLDRQWNAAFPSYGQTPLTVEWYRSKKKHLVIQYMDMFCVYANKKEIFEWCHHDVLWDKKILFIQNVLWILKKVDSHHIEVEIRMIYINILYIYQCRHFK